MTRLATGTLVSALIRRVQVEGGNAAVLARGHAEAGAILIVALERGASPRLLERGIGPAGEPALLRAGSVEPTDAEITSYWQRRRTNDPDLWVIELDVPQVERFVAETILGG